MPGSAWPTPAGLWNHVAATHRASSATTRATRYTTSTVRTGWFSARAPIACRPAEVKGVGRCAGVACFEASASAIGHRPDVPDVDPARALGLTERGRQGLEQRRGLGPVLGQHDGVDPTGAQVVVELLELALGGMARDPALGDRRHPLGERGGRRAV